MQMYKINDNLKDDPEVRNVLASVLCLLRALRHSDLGNREFPGNSVNNASHS